MAPALHSDYAGSIRVLAARDSTNLDELHVVIDTTVLVKPYSRYYPGVPIQDFTPHYLALTDGSLISSALIRDLRRAYLALIICAATLVVFLINIVRCWAFVRSGKIKKKLLLYLVFISQLLAPVCLLPVTVAYVNQDVNCTAVGYLILLCAPPSLALLITGVFGIKAYRCLENSRVVGTVLGAIRGGALVILGLIFPTTKTGRRLSGSCLFIVDRQLSFIYILLQLAEGLFICGCFFYAVFKSHGQPSIRGRISLRLSMDRYGSDRTQSEDLEGSVFGDQNAVPPTGTISTQSDIVEPPTSRGWWDMTPTPVSPQKPVPPPPRSAPSTSRFSLWWRVLTLRKGQHDLPRKSSMHGDVPLQPLHAPGNLTDANIRLATGGQKSRYAYWRRRLGLATSSGSTLGRLMPQMLFKAVVRDELLYTTFMATSTVVVAIISAVGLTNPLELDVNNWILLNWTLVSFLIMHSFSRAIRRHEREALLRQGAAWDVPPTGVRAQQPHNRSARSSRQVPSVSFSILSSHQSHNRRREKDGEEFELEQSKGSPKVQDW